MKANLTFFSSYWEALKDLPDDLRHKLLDAVLFYAFEDVEPDLSGLEKTVFEVMRPNINSSMKASASGLKGGRGNKLDSAEKGSDQPIDEGIKGSKKDDMNTLSKPPFETKGKDMDMDMDMDTEMDVGLRARASAYKSCPEIPVSGGYKWRPSFESYCLMADSFPEVDLNVTLKRVAAYMKVVRNGHEVAMGEVEKYVWNWIKEDCLEARKNASGPQKELDYSKLTAQELVGLHEGTVTEEQMLAKYGGKAS